MSMEYEIIAKTFYGLETVLSHEIEAIGGKRISILNRAVRFYGDKSLIYKANLHLRAALRILIPVLKTRIKIQQDLYHAVRNFEWEKYISARSTFAVDSFIHDTIFTNSHYMSLKVKDAIVDRFRDKSGSRPDIDTSNPDLIIDAHLAGNELIVSIDTSGESLYKRGYRAGSFPAAMNEVLAAGIILLSGWNGSNDLYDPMCGSGTFSIEAVMLARNIPPGIFRKQFAFERSPDFEKSIWTNLVDDVEEKNWNGTVYASDISSDALKIALESSKKAFVKKNISFSTIDFETYPQVQGKSTVFLNPPYGERMKVENMSLLYKKIGDVLKKSFCGGEAWLISSNMDELKQISLRPSAKYKVFNGALECRLLKFEMYSGSRKTKTKSEL